MENVKRKRREVVNKNNGSKSRKKSDKKTKKKAKEKENFKSLIAGYKSCRLTVQGGSKGRRTKQKQATWLGKRLLKERRVDGMFLKGIRTEYITRESLNEANEARKNEDINKIIDMGRVFWEKGELPVPRGRAVERVAACERNGKPRESSPDSEENSRDSVEEFSLSSISADDDAPVPPETPLPLKRKLHTGTELRKFALSYEAAVAAQVLHRLPDSGVFEDALVALRKLQEKKQNSAVVSPDPSPHLGVAHREESLFPKEFPFSRDDSDLELPPTDDFLLPRGFHCENFAGEPSGNLFIVNTTAVETPNHPSHFTVFDNDEGNKSWSVIKFQAKDFQKPVKELGIATPPFHFYPRNMF